MTAKASAFSSMIRALAVPAQREHLAAQLGLSTAVRPSLDTSKARAPGAATSAAALVSVENLAQL